MVCIRGHYILRAISGASSHMSYQCTLLALGQLTRHADGNSFNPQCLSPCIGSPLDLIASETLRWKVQEPVLLLGKQRFAGVDIRIRAKGGGHISQIYGMHCLAASSLLSSQLTLSPVGWCLHSSCVMCSHPTSYCKGTCGILPEM